MSSRAIDRVRLRNALNRGDLFYGDTTDTVLKSLGVGVQAGSGIADIVQKDKKKDASTDPAKKPPEAPKPPPKSSGMPTWAKVGLGVGGGLVGVGLLYKLFSRR